MKYLEKIDLSLCENLRQWNEVAKKNQEPPIDIYGVIYMMSDLEMAVFYSELFFPELIVHDGGVFIKAAIDLEGENSLYNHMKRQPDLYSRSAIEAKINYTRVWDLFSKQHNNDELYIILAKRLAFIWDAYLKKLYPDRQFEVVYDENPEEYELGPAVTFFQPDPESSLKSDQNQIS